MTENFEALKTVDLTDDDLFIVQDKETGFKQRLTKAELVAAIFADGGGVTGTFASPTSITTVNGIITAIS